MKTLLIEIPDSLQVDELEAKLAIAAKLYEKGSLSLGQAAELAGQTKRSFMELLSDFNIPLFQMDETALENDINNAKNYHL